jgi:hypothetical protein
MISNSLVALLVVNSNLVDATPYPGQAFLAENVGVKIWSYSLRNDGRVLIVKPTGEATEEQRLVLGNQEGESAQKNWVSIQPVEDLMTSERIELVIKLEAASPRQRALGYKPASRLNGAQTYLVWIRNDSENEVELVGTTFDNHSTTRFARKSEREFGVYMLMPTEATTVNGGFRQTWQTFFSTMLSTPEGRNSQAAEEACQLITRFEWERNVPPYSTPDHFRLAVKDTIAGHLARYVQRTDLAAFYAALALNHLRVERSFDVLWSLTDRWKLDTEKLDSEINRSALSSVSLLFAPGWSKSVKPSNDDKISLALAAANAAITEWAVSGLVNPTGAEQRRLLPLLERQALTTRFSLFRHLAKWNQDEPRMPKLDVIQRNNREVVREIREEALLRQYWTNFLNGSI